MPKGRHRKQQLTQLPAGSRAITGKAQSATKARTYERPLPVAVVQGERRGQGAWREPYRLPTWADYLLAMCGYPNERTKQKQRELDAVVGKWDPLSKAVYVDVTLPVSAQQSRAGGGSGQDDDGGEQQSEAMRYLWQSGFFGKGTLSRSEPTWHRREVNTVRVRRERERGGKVYTPEELTALRRRERKAAKIERARLAVRAGQQLPDGIVALGGQLSEHDEQAIERAAESEVREEEKDESAYGKHIPGLIYLKPQEKAQVEAGRGSIEAPGEASYGEDEYVDVADMERLQLSNYETLFLAGMLGVLQVVDEEDRAMSLDHLYALLMATPLPHRLLPASPFSTPTQAELAQVQAEWSRADNPFLLNYVAYHHFRSLGWVVKSGIKFCADFLLYKRGPAFSHAEFAVLVIPVYEDPSDEASSPFGQHANGNERSWVWFSSVNRVNTQVLKTVILCHVTIPPLTTHSAASLGTPQAFVSALQEGRLHHIREYSIRRFTPQRMKA